MPYKSYPDRLLARFWAKVRKTDTCWEWTGARDANGYGNVNRGGRYFKAHRYAWQLEHGDVPCGMDLCHHCDNPSCVRPDHLFVGTRTDNMRDAARKRRLMHGENQNHAKLRAGDVVEIRSRWAQGATCDEIAATVPVTRAQVHRVATGQNWAHIKEED